MLRVFRWKRKREGERERKKKSLAHTHRISIKWMAFACTMSVWMEHSFRFPYSICCAHCACDVLSAFYFLLVRCFCRFLLNNVSEETATYSSVNALLSISKTTESLCTTLYAMRRCASAHDNNCDSHTAAVFIPIGRHRPEWIKIKNKINAHWSRIKHGARYCRHPHFFFRFSFVLLSCRCCNNIPLF